MRISTIIYFFQLAALSSLTAQQYGRDSSTIRFSFEVPRRYCLYENAAGTQGLSEGGYIGDSFKSYRFLLGIRVAPHLIIETGWSAEMFWTGWGPKDHLTTHYNFMHARVVPFRACYQVRLFDVFKNPVRLMPSVGILFCRKAGEVLSGGGAVQIQWPGYLFVAKESTEIKSSAFCLGELRLQLEASISKVIGETRGTYSINNGPERTVITQTKGTNYYLNAGIRLRIPNFWK
jgi:hypothetical protein